MLEYAHPKVDKIFLVHAVILRVRLLPSIAMVWRRVEMLVIYWIDSSR
jgi:hypothetical protein